MLDLAPKGGEGDVIVEFPVLKVLKVLKVF